MGESSKWHVAGVAANRYSSRLPVFSEPQRRGRRAAESQRHRVRPGLGRVHPRHQQGHVRERAAGRRHGVRQHLQQDRRGGAFRGLQTVWLRQRPW